MKKRVKRALCALLSAAVLMPAFPAVNAGAASAYQAEYLDRGLVAVKTNDGIFLSWRLLGTESTNTEFDIYRDGEFLTSTKLTNYTDNEGFLFNTYQVVPKGTSIAGVKKTEIWNNSYLDIPIEKPANGVIDKTGEVYTYSANDATVADVDGDGQYEIILKWYPSNAQDNSQGGYTGIVYLDCYRMDGTRLWRIDMGKNIRAGAHYTQFIAYDFNGDGKAELAMKTAPGTIDGEGNFVTRAGNTSAIRNQSNSVDYRSTSSGKYRGQIITGAEYLTMFDGLTGKALRTIDYEPSRGTPKSWGKDNYGGRSERYLAGVAYLNGKTPSLIMCRGYYQRAAMAAYNWNGSDFEKVWLRDDKSAGTSSIYGQGAHSLSVADVDNDGFDEVIFGSAIVDHDGSVLSNTRLGHGDALHVSDFDNDGKQEIFMVHEDKAYACAEFHNADGSIFARVNASDDVGRGIAGNIDANPAKTTKGALFYSSASSNLFDINANAVGTAPAEMNFLVYWDGDLSRELLDKNRIVKYDSSVGTTRLMTFNDVHHNNSTKATPTLSADLFGDWREEVIFPTYDDSALRIFTTTIPTEYKIPTLMHDPQYRAAIAWQNVGYNQPPHTSYYIGAESASGNTIAPKTAFKSVYTTPHYDKGSDEEESKVKEELVMSAQSFNGVDMGGFTKGMSTTQMSVMEISAPFKNVLSVNSQSAVRDLSELDTAQETGVSIESFTLSDDSHTSAVKLTNLTANSEDITLVLAGYDENGALSEVVTAQAIANFGESAQMSAALSKTAASSKAMLWNSKQQPLCAPLTEAGSSYSAPIDPEKINLVLKASFMWMPRSGQDRLRFHSSKLASNRPLLSIDKTSASGAITCVYYAKRAGVSTSVVVDDSLNKYNNWYLIDVTFDFASQTMDVAILDYSTPGAERQYLYGIPMPEDVFVDNLSRLQMLNSSYLDNFTIKRLTYSEPRSVAAFTVVDDSGNPVQNAKIQIGSYILKTGRDGTARVKLDNGSYSYTVTRDASKTAYGTVDVSADVQTPVTLHDGETRNVYVHYVNTYGTQISPDILVGEGTENTSFEVSESMKQDITYTFTDDGSSDDENITDETHKPGDTVVYEYDADNSNVGNVRINEGSDTIISFVYKEKRVPVAGLDSELVKINMSENGFGKKYYSLANSAAAEYVNDSRRYLSIPSIENNNLTINLPSGQSKFVMEFDMMFEDMDFGGNVFGFTPYSGTNPGTGIGIRTSGESTNQWRWVYGSGENYIPYTNDDKAYSYPSNWKNQWAHCILVSDGSGALSFTAANRNNGTVYIRDQKISMANGVGTAAAPITKLVFSKIGGTGKATIGFSDFKAYTIGAEAGGELFETTKLITIPGKSEFTLDTATHISDMEGVDYNIAGIIGVTYEIWDENNNPVNPDGFSISSDGILNVTTENINNKYKVAVLVNGRASTVYTLSYKVRSLVFESGFSGDTDGFVAGKGSNTSISANNGTLSFAANEANGGREFFKQFDGIRTGTVDISYTFKTGGVKGLVTPDAWNWSGKEYEFAIQFMDADYNAEENAANVNAGNTDVSAEHLLMEINQAYTTSAQDTYYKTFGSDAATIRSKWTKLAAGDGSVLNRSITTWVLNAHLDLDNDAASFTLASDSAMTAGWEINDVSIANTNGFGALRFLCRKRGSSVTWKPELSKVTVYHTR